MSDHIEITKTLTQGDFDRFAALSGDCNPIHIDPNFAAKTRFGKTVAHGALLVTILRGLTDQLCKGGQQISHSIKFPAPTYADQEMVFTATHIRSDKQGYHVALMARRQEDGVITCEGEAVLTAQKDGYADRG